MGDVRGPLIFCVNFLLAKTIIDKCAPRKYIREIIISWLFYLILLPCHTPAWRLVANPLRASPAKCHGEQDLPAAVSRPAAAQREWFLRGLCSSSLR